LKKRRKVKEEKGGGGQEEGERRDEHDDDETRALQNEATAGVHEEDAVVNGGNGDGGVIRFPSILHSLLTRGRGVTGGERADHDGSAIASAVEWLPHGRGFRVLRWDELCRGVLPVEFPALCRQLRDGTTRTTAVDRIEENGGEDVTAAVAPKGNQNDCMEDGVDYSQREIKRDGCSDDEWIDSFLWNVRAWGFQEVTAGVDRGSFRHEVRDSTDFSLFSSPLILLMNSCSPSISFSKEIRRNFARR
jgi:hypothetical protein